MLDQRLGDAMLCAVRTLPPRSAVVIRPHAMSDSQRQRIRAVRRIARARGHMLLLAGADAQWADGIHASGHGGAHLCNQGRGVRRGAAALLRFACEI
nr:thiamine phosphate synthase [Sphingopyxis sp.]